MSKSKKKIGLQKDFSKIFDGVWVPQRPGREQARIDEAAQDRSRAVETPASDDKTLGSGNSAAPGPERAIPAAASEEHRPVGGMQASQEPDHDGGGPAPAEQGQNGDTAALREHNREIEKIMDSMKCPKGFVCYRSGFSDLCKVTTVGEGKVIECSPENRGPCMYRFSFAGRVFCKCALRYYIARNLNR